MTGFYFYTIDSKIYHGYFEPVGGYSGGEGNIWITQSPWICPLIEKTVDYEHAVLWDYSDDEFDGSIVDQNECMRLTIIDKLKLSKDE